MNSLLHIPAKLKVGFQGRDDTYTGKLAYVIPMNEKGKVRKEKSFESWRDHHYLPEEYENEPTSGFVLNKKAGGYATGWNHRKTYIRVYDPRGFEFEISVENHLYILEHTNSIVGKGLEGDFVYSWSGKDLVLLPLNASEYVTIKKEEEMKKNQDYVKARELKVGATYKTPEDAILVYLGKYDEYRYDWRNLYHAIKKPKPTFHFCEIYTGLTKEMDYIIHRYPTIAGKLTEVVENVEHPQLNEMMEYLAKQKEFSPIDLNLTKVVPMKLESFLKRFDSFPFSQVIAENGKKYDVSVEQYKNNEVYFSGEVIMDFFVGDKSLKNTYNGEKYEVNSYEDVFNILKPHVTEHYLQNGTHYSTSSHEFDPHHSPNKS